MQDAPDIWIVNRKNIAPKGLSKMIKGSEPSDARGNLLLDEKNKSELEKKYPILKKYIKPFIGGDEFTNYRQGEFKRYCLWFENSNPSDFSNIKEIRERLNNVIQTRSKSSADRIRKKAEYPYLFCQIRQPKKDYSLFPQHTSGNRKYIPIGYMSKDVIVGNACYIISDAPLYLFGIMMSNVFMSWFKLVCGRLGNEYRYSPAIYNNFPFIEFTEKQKAKIEKTSRAILDARANHPESSLADLYDELTMPVDLRKAHQVNDKAVMEAYGFWGKLNTESECVAALMKMYQALVDKK